MFSRIRSRWVIFAHDVAWVPVSVTLAYWLRFNLGAFPPKFIEEYFCFLVIAIPVHAFTFWLFGCYRGIWRFASIPDFLRLAAAVGVGVLVTVLALFMTIRLVDVPRSAIVLYPLLLLAGVGGARVVYRAIRDHGIRPAADMRPRALVLGAGRAGEMLVRDLLRHGPFHPVALLDDDRLKHGKELHGVRVRGRIDDLPQLVRSYDVSIVLIAMPSAGREVMDRIVRLCTDVRVEFRTLPTLQELSHGKADSSQLRPVTVEDLLGRDPIDLDCGRIADFLANRVVTVTGGGGSIGSELCRQIAAHGPRTLLVIDNSEFNLYRIEMELKNRFAGVNVVAVIGDVRDAALMQRLFARHQPSVVFHAAAYKHVPILEENPCQGVLNNVAGTKVIADVAVEAGVERFVLVSTDKTVNPTSVMGATKRVAEIYCQNLGRRTATRFITTRFGNVLGSCGSAIPLFEEQIRSGGPVTVTDPEVTRYFMTTQEAVGLILQATVIGSGGEIFVMDMGKPILIRELVEKMIRLTGKVPQRDIEVVYTGLRPGEKLHEELFYKNENLVPTQHPKLLQASSFPVDWSALSLGLAELTRAAEDGNTILTIDRLRELVPEFATRTDWSHHARAPHLRVIQ